MGSGLSRVEEVPDYAMEVQMKAEVPVEDVIATAQAAGRAILQIYNSEASTWEVQMKSDASPLTRADREANAVICQALQNISPHIPIISEENKMTPHSVRQKFQYYWLVDPLDGTKEFLKRNGQFTVNIALMSSNTPVLGVVDVPCQGKTYWAVKGKGAWLRTSEGQQRIQAAEFGFEDKGLKICASASHLNKETEEFIQLFESPEFVQVGSSLKLLMVAEGQAHIYPRLAPTCEWDTAAADIIVREAGGVVLQAGKQDNKGNPQQDWKEELVKEVPVVYNKEDVLNPYFVVFGKRRGGSAAAR
ncbi:hypothetical protein PLESTB_000017400 [Pleodorina starrii]|uniref:3'(2'),5'-bisphosphate nucleotidase 1 n=1 Tax=Pleodorina starrii TaxID=330485 RepID=A0A9W6B9K3_9CHLO|nr:hypothetical protein PLESTM_001117100 [Pleodorina starrii]GLC47708.1 hypothetical protein PLESTB_000017400 [Pleodorina starrii]GLC70880.1 hypothetical protein PLESTF_001042800 [Pleodorina starrii]